MRAGKLALGDENTFKMIRSNQAKLVLIANDASAHTRKKFQNKCEFYGATLLEICSKSELGRSVGKEASVILAVLDEGFAKSLQKYHENLTEVERIDE